MHEEVMNLAIALAFVIPLLLSILLIWVFLSYQNRKFRYETDIKDAMLREQGLIIQNQKDIQEERNRIAGEMHDELGSGLTVIKYLSDSIISKTENEEIKNNIHKIATYSTILVNNMSEIIWAMNSRYDSIEGFISYVRRYVVEYLEDNGINNTFIIDNNVEEIAMSGEKRRNLFLIIKELIHNSVKYSQCDSLEIWFIFDQNIQFKILEKNAVGFDADKNKDKGNGLYNIEKRLSLLNGNIQYQKINNDMKISVIVPFLNPTINK
jgi:signal transduction histidine kinase